MKGFFSKLLVISAALLVITGCTKQEKMTKAVDAVTTASIVNNIDDLATAMSAEGVWLAATVSDIKTSKDLVIDGEFKNRGEVDRKLALNTQDASYKTIDRFTLTAPKMIVKSPNFRLTGGIFVGDIYVEANGFKLDQGSTLEGNIYFEKQEYMDSFVINAPSTHVGEKSVK